MDSNVSQTILNLIKFIFLGHLQVCFYFTHVILSNRFTIKPNFLLPIKIFYFFLGGFIAQKFTELTQNCPRVASLVLCNSFTDTSVFEYNDSSALFWLLPSLVLKRMLMGNFTSDKVDRRIAESIDFMVERVRIYFLFNCSTSYQYQLQYLTSWCLVSKLLSN